MKKDNIFTKPIEKGFEFDEEVAAVFDDMITRSVPFYKEVLDLVCELTDKNVPDNALIYDLGSSTGSTLIALAKRSKKSLHLVGIDNSQAMISRAKKKAKAFGVDIEFLYADILHFPFQKAHAFLANYTLQFIRPLQREKLVRKIYEHLHEEGVFIFSEKVICEDKKLDKQLIDIYYTFKKRQGYSDFEIAQKREALENVLVPFTLKENEEMVKSAGFSSVEPIFRWANFATFFARK